MKFAILFCLLLAVSAGAEVEGCSPERVVTCVQALAMGTLEEGDTTDEEMCKDMRTATDCLRTEADACTAGMQDDEVEDIQKDLQGLEKLLKENCEESGNEDDNDDGDTEEENCIQENGSYVFECVERVTEEVVSQIAEIDNNDRRSFKCSMYRKMASCYVDRISEKCGQEVGEVAEVEFKHFHGDIEQDCEDDNLDILEAFFDKKKK